MSGFKKVIKRAPYKERSQPNSRKRLGLLEKHKDYSLRAKDYNKKKAQLTSLREKAANRNEDEFYHGMLSRKGPGSAANALVRASGRGWKGTVDADRGNQTLDMDTVRLLKTQDLGYVRTMRNVATREVRKLEERVVTAEAMLQGNGVPMFDDDDDEDDDDNYNEDFDSLVDLARRKKNGNSAQSKQPKKVVFVDDAEERDNKFFENVDSTGKEQGGDEELSGVKVADPVELRKIQLERLKRRLEKSKHRLRILGKAERELEQQKTRMAKTQSTGVVTKKGNLVKVKVRKR